MAEGDGAQNQGMQQQSGQSKEVPADAAAEQKKLDRAAKERERRRRRRRKKAELRRLEREALEQGAFQKPVKPVPETPSVPESPATEPATPASSPAEPSTSESSPAEPATPEPGPRVSEKTVPKEHKAVEAQKKRSLPEVPGQQESARKRQRPARRKIVKSAVVPAAEPVAAELSAVEPVKERHIAKRSEEHAPRSKDIVPQAKPKEEQPQKAVQEEAVKPAEEHEEELHPLSHKTHTFAGPLIVQQPEHEPLQTGQEPESVPGPAEPASIELGAQPEARPETQPETVEPVIEPLVQPESQPEPDVLVQPQPESPQKPQVELEPEPQPKSEPVLEEMPSIFPEEEPQDLVIHDEHEEVRPRVQMAPVHDEEQKSAEISPVLPNSQQPEKEEHEEEPVEEVKIEKKRPKAVEHEKRAHEQREAGKEVMSESEGLNERKSLLQGAGAFSAGVLKSLGAAFHNFRLKFDFKKLLLFVLLMIIGGGLYAGYYFKVHEKVYNYVAGFFKAPPPVEVNIDEQLLREWGITTALIFGDNRGSTRDLFASQLFNAYYFGYLSEPRVQGETGITPAYFYGKGDDLVEETNLFIGYVKNLRELVSVYDVDVYKMLDQTTDREKALNDHVAKLKDVQEKSNKIAAEIKTEIDDLKVSYESLNPEKTRAESDFFVALQGLAGEKSDFLLKSFIDVSQKQTALKARLAALQKLADYYDSSLKKLDIRITAIQKNFQALAQGIRVVDIPGANLDIIIKESP